MSNSSHRSKSKICKQNDENCPNTNLLEVNKSTCFYFSNYKNLQKQLKVVLPLDETNDLWHQKCFRYGL